MLDKMLSALDESIFTEESKQAIRESFEDAVNVRAQFIVEQKTEEIEAEKQTLAQELQQKIEELEAKDAIREEDFEKKIEELEAKAQEYIQYLEDKAEEFVEMKESEMLDKADEYLNRVVEEFVGEAKEALEESVKNKESELIREAFETMVKSTGKEFQKTILEGADETIRSEIQELKESYNEAMKEVFALKRENDELMKMGIISEMTEGLTLIESERFKRLVEDIEFTQDARYVQRLESMKESVKGLDPKGSKEEILTEEILVESKNSKDFGNLFSFTHLI